VLRESRYCGQREYTKTRQWSKELHSRRGRRGHYTLPGPNQTRMFYFAPGRRPAVRKLAARCRILISARFRETRRQNRIPIRAEHFA
jgi:hypothetical protein